MNVSGFLKEMGGDGGLRVCCLVRAVGFQHRLYMGQISLARTTRELQSSWRMLMSRSRQECVFRREVTLSYYTVWLGDCFCESLVAFSVCTVTFGTKAV